MKNTTDYKKVASHEAKKGEFDKTVLLYSGGLDTSIMLKWIQDHYNSKVIALTIDIGQNDDFNQIKEKALKLGACEAHVVDAKKEFCDYYLSKAVKANADYQGGYHMFCSIGRALISRIGVSIAHKEYCDVIAHGCTGKGNDQVRFEGYITTLDPKLKTIAPIREWSMGRDEELAYAKKHGIPLSHKKLYSYDTNIGGSSAEGGEIEEIEQIPKFDNILSVCNTPEKAPDKPEVIEIGFEEGNVVSINGKKKDMLQILLELNSFGAKHAIGINPMIEDRVVGLKVRGVYEEPGLEILIQAHKNLEQLVCTRQENEFKTMVDQKWAYLCYEGNWFHPLMDHLNQYIDSVNQKVTGTTTIKLYKGKAVVVAMKSCNSLLDHNMATFLKNDLFNQNASAGFIELWNLPQKMAFSIMNKNTDKKS